MGTARAPDTSGSPSPEAVRSLRSASPSRTGAADAARTSHSLPPEARARANQKLQRAHGHAGFSFLRKAEAEVTRGTGGGNHGAAGEGRSCRCRRCREPRR
ncbi:hypothetical protein I79_008775 [Cricetulus griseus]|uniref:Uncharacterized protein n=1 Tax=Cricetulus griseus TaxID=10029 RepID=G3HE06_CRIGR|nr:hypothetical protein I79_008775 [Cricetulus griseus]ERE85637.1 hypothetical protein H671_2g5104 [Cricetulus griseus]